MGWRAVKEQVDGLIIGNTTISRPRDLISPFSKESGGLSGRPLYHLSNSTLKTINELAKNKLLLIGVGGIMNKQMAEEKIKLGASLIQLYSGVIYHGPHLIKQCMGL